MRDKNDVIGNYTAPLHLQVKNDVIGYCTYTPTTAVVHLETQLQIQGHLSLLNTSVNFSFASVDFEHDEVLIFQ